jgi:XTP/dITP diphosphohydrolase
LRTYILEEAHEALEAIDSGNDKDMVEELGDLFYIIVFYGKVAEREKRFELKDILSTVREKMMRRHPHIFGDGTAKTPEEVMENWEKIKREEKTHRKTILEGIPKTLPSLQRAQKVLGRLKKHGCEARQQDPVDRCEELAQQLMEVVKQASAEKIDIESAFRKHLSELEAAAEVPFR